jgi:non-ribosomal peptide synthetase component F
LSYARLDAAVRERVDGLGRLPGVVVVPARRSPDTIIDLLAIWAAGGTYCPIDPTFPEERQSAMRTAAGCGESSNPHSPELAAYILFTSGSTGEPKPVVTPHVAIEATVRSLRDLFALSIDDRVLQFASLNWDTCFEEILPTLTTGAALVFHDEAYTGSFPRFLRMVEHQGITLLDLPTAFWHELVLYLAEEAAALPECLRVMVIGGEPVNPARLAQWCALETSAVRLVNTYGCTETTLVTHAADLYGPLACPDAIEERVPIGAALPHVIELVGDDDELLIGGPALALGYKGLPEATQARFVELEGERYFRTGDRVSRAKDGMLIHEGRLDAEVKIRGIRVHPAEVEAHIGAHPAVSAVAVMGVTLAGRTALVAYIVPRGDETGLAEDVLEHLRTRVPPHLVPSRITVVPQLVYTTSGKIDRAKSKESFDER